MIPWFVLRTLDMVRMMEVKLVLLHPQAQQEFD
jgi:hypothetical protein